MKNIQMKWRLKTEDNIEPLLKEFCEGCNKKLIDISTKDIMGIPMPTFTVKYKKQNKDYILTADLPLPHIPIAGKVLTAIMMKSAEMQLKKMFKSFKYNVKIKRIR